MAFSNYSYGVEVTGPATIRFYEFGTYLRTFTYYREYSGGYLGFSGRQMTGSVGTLTGYNNASDRVPIWVEDFEDLSNFVVGHNGGNWSASGGKARIAAGADLSSVLCRPMEGATFFEVTDLDFDNTDSADRWFMLTPNKVGTGRTDDPDRGGPGDDGYRCLVRQRPNSGSHVPESGYQLEIVNHIGSFVEEFGGWHVGSLGFG